MTDKQDSVQSVLDEMQEYAGYVPRVREWADRIESLLNAEPVAWVLLGKDGALHYRSVPPTATIAESYETRPLYAAPQPSEDCAALREAIIQHLYAMRHDEDGNDDVLTSGMEALLDALEASLSTDAGRDYAERLRKAEEERDAFEKLHNHVSKERDQLRAELEYLKKEI